MISRRRSFSITAAPFFTFCYLLWAVFIERMDTSMEYLRNDEWSES